MKHLLFLTLVVIFTSCEFSGTMNANKNLIFKRKSFFGKTKNFQIKKGVYNAKFNFTSKKMKVKLSGVKYKIKFNIPKQYKYKNTFTLTSNQSGQPYDLQVHKDVDTLRTGPYEGTQSCSYHTQEYICKIKCSSPGDCKKVCDYQDVYHSGYENISYFSITKTIDVVAKIMAKSSNLVLGRLNGISIKNSRDIIYKSHCFATRY